MNDNVNMLFVGVLSEVGPVSINNYDVVWRNRSSGRKNRRHGGGLAKVPKTAAMYWQ
jgi:hypothetical protein